MAGLLRRIASAIRNRPDSERRDAGGFSVAGAIGGYAGPGSTGNLVNAYAAENVATITAAVQLVASTVGGLPSYVYRREGEGRIEAPNHPVARLLHAPNERQTWCDFMEWTVGQFLLFGNALALIETDGAGQPVRLRPIPWPYVLPLVLHDGTLAFDVLQTGPWGTLGLPARVLSGEVLHLKDRSDDGYVGRSRLSRAPQVIQNALGLQEYSVSIWNNYAAPSGAITHPGKLNHEGRNYLRESINSIHAGASNAKRVAILDEGMKWEPFSSTPEDAEVLASRRFSTEECARLMGVPPPLVGIWDHSSFTNSATASSWMGTFTILPIVRKIEAEFARSVFADPFGPFHLELDLSGLLRGDATAQRASNVADVGAGIMTKDEARHDLGLNPLGGSATPQDGALPGVQPS